MQDETQDDDVTPADETPAEDSPEEQPAPAEEAPATEEGAPAEDSPDEQPAPAEEVAPPDEGKPTAEPERTAESAAPKEKSKGEEAPGANLEPIRLEDDRELSAEERARLEAEQEERARLEAAATEDGGDDEPLREGAKLELPAGTRIQATGKRKTSVARVIVGQGGGEIKVNRRDLDEYFPRSFHQTIARQALVASGYDGQVDVAVRVHGGGISGQADAVRHGIARALVEIDPELRGELKRRGMLTRDARAKERRKAGLKKARKRPQFSKR